MPTVEQHINQWRHNRRFAEKIDPAFRDWQINVIFYAALHAVDAAMAHLGVKVTDHEARNHFVRTNASLSAIRVAYLDLYRISKVTRYDADPESWLPEKFLMMDDLVKSLLRPIENEVERLVGKAAKMPALKVQE